MQTLLALGLAAWAALATPAHAYTRNEALREQVSSQEHRKLPCRSGELYCLAMDGHLFYRVSDSPGYYHGGYWLSPFLELNPVEPFFINTKVVTYNPAASYGVAATSYLHPFVGLTWKDNLTSYGAMDLGIRMQVADLDRQTLGAGLTLQDKEMSGFLIALTRGPARFRWIFDGTGGYHIPGDLFYYELDLWNQLIGFHVFTVKLGDQPFFSIYSVHPLGPYLRYRAEASRRNSSFAALAGLETGTQAVFGPVSASGWVQGRTYGKDYATRIKRAIQHDYVSIEQDDKKFTDSMNIFAIDDNVRVAAAGAEVKLELLPQIGLFTSNEVAEFSYRSVARQRYFFYRHGVELCPRADIRGCGRIFYSNKLLNADYNPVTSNDASNKQLFVEQAFVGFEARFEL